MLHIGICDDEKGTCAALEDMLYEYAQKQTIKMEIDIWYTGEGLCNYLGDGYRLDILFLDIELISTDGIEVGKFIRDEMDNMETIIIYISSKSSYAMSLFRIQPLDFLIKPLLRDDVYEVMQRSIKIYERKNLLFEYYACGYYFKIPYKDIIYFYSQNKKINIVLKNKEMQFNGKLKELANKVPHNFILIHQSYLINLDFVVECSYDSVKMRDGSMLNISQPYRKIVREQIMKNEWEKIQ